MGLEAILYLFSIRLALGFVFFLYSILTQYSDICLICDYKDAEDCFLGS